MTIILADFEIYLKYIILHTSDEQTQVLFYLFVYAILCESIFYIYPKNITSIKRNIPKQVNEIEFISRFSVMFIRFLYIFIFGTVFLKNRLHESNFPWKKIKEKTPDETSY